MYDKTRLTKENLNIFQVRSHTIETEEISFEEKLRRDREARDDETDYQMELRGEGKCRAGITREQLDGLWFLNKVGLISSFVSLVASVVALAAMRSREDGTNRFLLIPYIMVHPGLIGMEIFALIYSYKLVHTMSSIHVVMVSLSVLLLVIFTSLVVLFYKALSALPLGAQNSSIGKGKEAFDYSTMPEEKDASEA